MLLKALSDETRLNIVGLLLGGERCVCEIYPNVRRAQSTVSIQLGKLENWGILASSRHGKWIFYRIRDKRVHSLFKALGLEAEGRDGGTE